jgi:signal transduction histidine kinase
MDQILSYKNGLKLGIITIFIAIISIAIVITRQSQYQYHSVYREFYLFPLVLAAFWFGLRGALLTSGVITCFYLIFLWSIWYGWSAETINAFIEILFLNGMGLILGLLHEREKREQRRSQKMENLAIIGKTVSGIAHDMKIPLVAIAGFARRILKKMDGDNPHREQLTIIYQEAQRLENMVKDMLDYARPLNLRLSRENVNLVIEESLILLKGTAEAKQVTLVSRLFPDIVAVEFDPSRMKQVFINLLTNAVQASPAGETVSVSSNVDGGKIVIDVTDHGHGLTAEQKENIFTPFFTTKKEGIGLGLIMVKNIVLAHRGQVQFFDNPPPTPGVTFRVVLPKDVGIISSSIQK